MFPRAPLSRIPRSLETDSAANDMVAMPIWEFAPLGFVRLETKITGLTKPPGAHGATNGRPHPMSFFHPCSLRGKTNASLHHHALMTLPSRLPSNFYLVELLRFASLRFTSKNHRAPPGPSPLVSIHPRESPAPFFSAYRSQSSALNWSDGPGGCEKCNIVVTDERTYRLIIIIITTTTKK